VAEMKLITNSVLKPNSGKASQVSRDASQLSMD